MKVIYLASPYTNRSFATKDWRACRAAEISIEIWKQLGIVAYSPIAAWHPWLSTLNLEAEYPAWAIQDKEIVRRSDELWVLMLEGWETSGGIKDEMNFARSEGKPVKYVLYNYNKPANFKVLDESPVNTPHEPLQDILACTGGECSLRKNTTFDVR